MSEELLVRQAAPTLAGIKTGSLFPCQYETRRQLTSDIRHLNRILRGKGLCLLPLRMRERRALLYLYRPATLRRDLSDGLARDILTQAGYEGDSCGRCVATLIRRLRQGSDFPHEIGLFLSYPPEDVRGFVENHACNYKCAGLWKVYGDERQAQRLFDRFKRCTDTYYRLWQAGATIEQLAVAG